jgi:hypothetical protein
LSSANQCFPDGFIGNVVHCQALHAREGFQQEAAMMFIWLVPLGIIALTLLFFMRKFGTKDRGA